MARTIKQANKSSLDENQLKKINKKSNTKGSKRGSYKKYDRTKIYPAIEELVHFF